MLLIAEEYYISQRDEEWKSRRDFMKKKIIAFLTGCMIIVGTITPAYASSFSLGGYSGSNSLSKGAMSATGKTTFATGQAISAYRYVSVTITYREGNKAKTRTYDKSASTGPSYGYSNTTASITVNTPSDYYKISSAKSSHKTTYGLQVNTETLNK